MYRVRELCSGLQTSELAGDDPVAIATREYARGHLDHYRIRRADSTGRDFEVRTVGYYRLRDA